jgi:hypothetical protein
VIGLSHVRKGKPNQDAIRWFPADDGLEPEGVPVAVAVADGHGETACVRSHLGARFAVQTAVDVLAKLATDERWLISPDVSALRQYAKQLLNRIVSDQWVAQVEAHHEQHPFSDDEIVLVKGAAAGDGSPLMSKQILKAYGCTLVAAVVSKSWLLAVQVGDGAIMAANASGETHLLIPPNEAHFGDETTSLCTVPADMQVVVRPLEGDVPVALMLCTDGYEKAFPTEYFRTKLLGEYVEYFRKRYGWREVYRDLPGILEDASARGSGDDATVGFIVNDGAEWAGFTGRGQELLLGETPSIEKGESHVTDTVNKDAVL